MLTQSSGRTARCQRCRALVRNAGDVKCHCVGYTEWDSRRGSGAVNKHICYWCQIPDFGWTVVLAHQCYPRAGFARPVETSAGESSGKGSPSAEGCGSQIERMSKRYPGFLEHILVSSRISILVPTRLVSKSFRSFP
jgi:hypothetical protein